MAMPAGGRWGNRRSEPGRLPRGFGAFVDPSVMRVLLHTGPAEAGRNAVPAEAGNYTEPTRVRLKPETTLVYTGAGFVDSNCSSPPTASIRTTSPSPNSPCSTRRARG